MMKRWNPIWLTLGILLSCARRRDSMCPVPSLPYSVTAASAFRAMGIDWRVQDPVAQQRMLDRLQDFLKRYSQDGLIPFVFLDIALLHIERGEWDQAERWLKAVESISPGVARDRMMVVRARLYRKRGDIAHAKQLLSPLAGKLVDEESQELWSEEMTLTVSEEGSAGELFGYADMWLNSVPEIRRLRVRREIADLFSHQPYWALERALRDRKRQSRMAPMSRVVREILQECLVDVALRDQNIELAHWLWSFDEGLRFLSPEKRAFLASLALQKAHPIVHQREEAALGVVITSATQALAESSAAVLQGMTWTLERMYKERDPKDRPRLLIKREEEVGGMEHALAVLEQSGAVVIFAALTSESADQALAWSQTASVPVMLLAMPSAGKGGAYGFVVGSSREQEEEVLVSALHAQKLEWDQGVREDSTESHFEEPACQQSFSMMGGLVPLIDWKRQRLWLLTGEKRCAIDFLEQAAERKAKGVIALGLASATVARPLPHATVLVASAGQFPVLEPAINKEVVLENDELYDFWGAFARPPDWWMALGRDAAVLACNALVEMASQQTEWKGIREYRYGFREALLRVQPDLWTTKEHGFAGSPILHRTIEVFPLLSTSATRGFHQGDRKKSN
ncbi:hypothetical protein [Pajaroellobacter abortibovis]|uniref:Uncharacterized protein n=1 Tax=Pajaroellobacter abortibovis TaxID=1882918 RepID=A0A1L6MZ87_9BACT|nr:hypothetical protein [Pajaroellobacter abortibovis]APS00715.1 hypothetical protein BCY86_08515 [Pajaroellobacter abortibovis]